MITMKTLRARSIGRSVMLAMGLWAAAGSALAVGACTVSSTGLAFGAYQPLTFVGKLTSADKMSTATVSVVCSGIAVGGSYTVSLGAGNYGGGDRISTRYLNNSTNGGDLMAFNVYTQLAYSTVWGNGSVGSPLSGSIPTGNSSQSHTVYGRVPGGQSTLKAGSFGDTLTMTITYNP